MKKTANLLITYHTSLLVKNKWATIRDSKKEDNMQDNTKEK